MFGCDPKVFTYSQPVRVPGALGRTVAETRLVEIFMISLELRVTIISLNQASHCDIAWAGALASDAPTQSGVFATVVYDDDETPDQRLWGKSTFARFIETGAMPGGGYYSRPAGATYGPK